jgi:hypothetical protein
MKKEQTSLENMRLQLRLEAGRGFENLCAERRHTRGSSGKSRYGFVLKIR